MIQRTLGAVQISLVVLLSILVGGVISAGTIDVAWDPVSHPDLVGYRVYWGTSSGTYPSDVDVGLVTATQLSGLSECTTYYVAVKGRGSDGSVSTVYSNEITGWSRPQLLGASPATVQQGTTLDLTITGWNFDPGASVTFSNPNITINGTSVNSCSEIVVNITVGASAATGSVDADVVNPDQVFGTTSGLFSVGGDQTAPTISGLQASAVGSTTSTINWTTDEAADGQVFFRVQGATSYQSSALDTTMTTGHSIDLLGLTPSTTYEFYVSSTDASSNGATSGVQTFQTQSSSFVYMTLEAETGPVSPPLETVNSGSTAVFGGGRLQVQAGTPQGTSSNPAGTKDYGVYIPQGGSWNVWFRIRGPNTSALSWFWRANGGTFEIVAASTDNEWQWIAGSQITLGQGQNVITLGGRDAEARLDRILITDDSSFQPTEVPGVDVTAPAAPTGLAASTNSGEVSLSWSNPSDGDLDRIVVRYRTDGVFPSSPHDGVPLVDRSASPGSPESELHTGLTDGVTYSYSVFAIDDVGNVSDSSTVAATPQGAPIGQVPNVRRTDTVGGP